MFNNFGNVLVQLVGFLGVFGFFIYQLLSENKNDLSSSTTPTTQKNSSTKKINSPRKGLFGRQKKVKEEITKPKKRWFTK